jgi:hypothetical protein
MSIEEIDASLDVYAAEFGEGPTSFPKDEFRNSLISGRHAGRSYGYHFLSITEDPNGPPKGMASFFTFPRAGFGGYIVLDRILRGKGHLSEIIAVIEQYMIGDGQSALGWYGECDPADGTASIFIKRGFQEVDIDYRQPPLLGRPGYDLDHAPILQLLYKPFGDGSNPLHVTTQEFLSSVACIFQVIYRMDNPMRSEYYHHLAHQLSSLDRLRWKPAYKKLA